MKKNVISAAAIAIVFSAALSACGTAEPVPAENTDTRSEQTVSETSAQTETSAEETTTETSAETTSEAVSETETETATETVSETETVTETEVPVTELKAGEDPMLDELYSVNRSNAEKLYNNSIAKVYGFESAQGLEPLERTNTSDTFSARLWSYNGSCKELSFTMLKEDSGLITDKGLLLGTWVGVDDDGAAIIGGKPTVDGATIFHYGKEIADFDTLRKTAAEIFRENGYSDEDTENRLVSYVDPIKEHYVYSPVYILPFYDEEGFACLHLALDAETADTSYAVLRIAVSGEGYVALMSPDIGAFFPSVCSDTEITDQDFSSWSYGFLETDSVYCSLTKPSYEMIFDSAPDPNCELTMDESSTFCGCECLLGSWVYGVSCY